MLQERAAQPSWLSSLAARSAARQRFLLVALIVGLIGTFLASLALGSVNIPLGEIVTILRGGEPARAAWTTIVLDFRLTKAITAALAGAALGVSGLIMQTLFRNPLADPYVLGISSGASLGVAIVVLAAGTTGVSLLAGIGLAGDFALITAASLGSAAVLALVLIAARRVNSGLTLLILGLMFGYITSALVSLLIHFSIADRIQTYVNWTFGSFGGVTWSQMPLYAAGTIAGLVLANLTAKPLNALLLGDAYARSMGLDIRAARRRLITSAALLTGIVTAFCGPIGFLGIAVPHLARTLLRSSDHRLLLPACTLIGAMLALIADIIAQSPGSITVLPLNAITALFGAPVVVWMILRQREVKETFSA
ncbi:MAG: iron ABC transporter permease [Anaerolineae bacterium]